MNTVFPGKSSSYSRNRSSSSLFFLNFRFWILAMARKFRSLWYRIREKVGVENLLLKGVVRFSVCASISKKLQSWSSLVFLLISLFFIDKALSFAAEALVTQRYLYLKIAKYSIITKVQNLSRYDMNPKFKLKKQFLISSRVWFGLGELLSLSLIKHWPFLEE